MSLVRLSTSGKSASGSQSAKPCLPRPSLTVIATGDRELRWKSIAALGPVAARPGLIVGLLTWRQRYALGALTERCQLAEEPAPPPSPAPGDFADERLSSRDAEACLRDTGHNARFRSGTWTPLPRSFYQTWFRVQHP